MRAFLAGIIFLLLATATFAGVIGKVDSIGFGSLMRGDCWVPLLVQVTSDSAGPEEYQLQVVQTDRDGDDVIYARPITVNPGTTSFWTYFKPRSYGNGLPRGTLGSTQDLPRVLRIYLATPDGSKRIVQLNVSSAAPDMLEEQDRDGQRLIVCAGRPPSTREFNPQPVQNGLALVSGMSETSMFVSVDTRHMPDNVLGYDSVDAIVWTDSDVSKLDSSQFRAIREYVIGGGTLVILQGAEMVRTERFADMLPVVVGKIETTDRVEPLRTIMHAQMPKPPVLATTGRQLDAWENVSGPHRVARSAAQPEAYVAEWVNWPDAKPTPYIARRVLGSGTVIWVAQDVSDPSIRGIAYGWPNFWARVFDWPIFDGDAGASYQYLQVPPVRVSTGRPDIERIRRYWTSAGAKDIGASYVTGLDLESKTAALLSVAFLFFIVYWAVAGPGAYLLLAARKRTHLSWFFFALIALAATLLTVGVAQLVLRGGAQIRHVSLVRAPSGTAQPAHIESRFGIYLPQDRSDTEIALTGFTADGATVITPFAQHPRLAPSDEPNLRDTSYVVPIRNEDDVEKVVTAVPFRSTLKKLQAEWTGPLETRVTGSVRTNRSDDDGIVLVGSVTNNTGRDLSNVLFVYRAEDGFRPYRVLYQRSWAKGQTLDLARAIAGADRIDKEGVLWLDRQKGSFGTLNQAEKWLYQGYRASMMGLSQEAKVDDSGQGYRQSFYIASLFDILPPMRNEGDSTTRTDVMRRGVRDWDISHTAAAGALVVLATSTADQVPIPLTVEGEAPEGTGTTFWQFILPLDRTATTKPPTTQPSENTNVEK